MTPSAGISASSSSSPHLSYRADIDGLRAVAVLAVVAFHAFPDLVPGGFAGVDVFFVISGFLITGNLLRDLRAGTFTLRGFYIRRIRRIFPALVLVLAATLGIGWHTQLAHEHAQLGLHVAGGGAFLSNVVLQSESGYFDTAAALKPLLHLWSLAIEEQYYLFWPLLLGALHRWGRHGLAGVAALAAVSFLVGLSEVPYLAGYYGSFGRFWELFAGAILAIHRAKWTAPAAPWGWGVPIRQAAAILALATVLASFLLLDETQPFPGWRALAPVGATVLLIASGPQGTPVHRLLSSRAMVGVGLISYPLYLWHWPLLVFTRLLANDTPHPVARLASILLSALLATATYRLLERPLQRLSRPGWVSIGLALALLTVATLGNVIHGRGGVPDREVTTLAVPLDPAEVRDIHQLAVEGCGLSEEAPGLFQLCLSDRRGDLRLGLMGDSKAASLVGGLLRTAPSHGPHWTFMGGNTDVGAPLPVWTDHPQYNRYQAPLRLAVDTFSRHPTVRTVTLVGSARGMLGLSAEDSFQDLPDSPWFDEARQGLLRTVSRLVQADRRVVLVVDNPPLAPPERCVERVVVWTWLSRALAVPHPRCSLTWETYRAQTERYRAMLEEVAAHHPGSVRVFDPNDLYFDPDTRTCRHVIGGRRMFSYTDHPSDDAADLVGARLHDFIAAWGEP